MARKDANPGAKEITAERRRAALEYRKMGLSYRAIGAKLGITPSLAYKDVSRMIAEVKSQSLETAEEMVELEREWLDTAAAAIAPSVITGNLGAVKVGIRLRESKRKLLGLDKPTKIAPTNIDGTESFQMFDKKRLKIARERMEPARLALLDELLTEYYNLTYENADDEDND